MSGNVEIHQGVVLPDIDMQNRGRYKVHINDRLHEHLSPLEGIWCRNRVHPWAYNTDPLWGSYGSYYPLQAGTRVQVKIEDEDYENAVILKIVSDQECAVRLPLFGIPTERDMITTIAKTPFYYNIFQINEETFPQPSNSIHLYFNTQIYPIAPLMKGTLTSLEEFGGENDPKTAPTTDKRTTFIINEDGIHWWTADNKYVTIDKDANIAVNKNVVIKIGEDSDIHIKGNTKVLIDGNTDLHVGGNINILSDGTINVQATTDINLNCGTSAEDAKDATGYNTTSPGDKELTLNRVADIALAAGKMVT